MSVVERVSGHSVIDSCADMNITKRLTENMFSAIQTEGKDHETLFPLLRVVSSLLYLMFNIRNIRSLKMHKKGN